MVIISQTSIKTMKRVRLFMFYLYKSCENVSKFHQIKALQFDNRLRVVVWNINNCFNYWV